MNRHKKNLDYKIINKTDKYICLKIKDEFNNLAGMSITIGNALRRILLNNLMGTKITSLELRNPLLNAVLIEGLKEDYFEILANIKKVVLRSAKIEKFKSELNIKGPAIVTASDLLLPEYLFVVNPEQYLFTIIKDVSIGLTLNIEQGFGYKFSDESPIKQNDTTSKKVIDANFSPVIKVNYKTTIEESKKIKNKYVEVLFLEIWTNGSITPIRAFLESCKILSSLFSSFLIN